MRILVPALSGFLIATVLTVLARGLLDAEVLRRVNHRGRAVPVAAGILIPVTLVVHEAVLRTLEISAVDPDPAEVAGRSVVLVAALGFGLLGLFDDLAAEGADRGFRGHIGALMAGRLTTGGLKLLGGGLLALAIVASQAPTIGDAVLGAVVVALAANLGNLLDRAPGRTTKVALLLGAILIVLAPATDRPLLHGSALVLGAAAGLLPADLGERLMLGDTGANVIGAALGLGLVMTVGRIGQITALIVLLALNLLSERVSFSGVIERVGILRALDHLGRGDRPDHG